MPVPALPLERFPVLVDRRAGSAHLLGPLRRLGVNARLTTLPVADVSFQGYGPDGVCVVGIERKTVSEIVSAVQDSRFTAKQLPALLTAFGPWAWLLIEGRVRPGPEGELQTARLIKDYDRYRGAATRELVTWHSVGWTRQGHGYSEYQRFLMTLGQKAGVRVVCTDDARATAYWLHALHGWWQKPWASHKSAYRVQETRTDPALLTPHSLTRRLAAQLPGVYWTRSQAVAEHFGTPRALGYALWKATRKEWTVPGFERRDGTKVQGIGPGIAGQIVRALRKD